MNGKSTHVREGQPVDDEDEPARLVSIVRSHDRRHARVNALQRIHLLRVAAGRRPPLEFVRDDQRIV